MNNYQIIQILFIFSDCSLIFANENLLLETKSFNFNPNNIENSTIKSNLINEYEFNLYEQSFQQIINENCKKDLNLTLNSINQHIPWAIAMYDASVKSLTSIETGSIYQFGNFDECLAINNNNFNTITQNQHHEHPIQTQYCLIDVPTNDYQNKYARKRHQKNQNIERQLDNITSNIIIVYWGICVPVSCELNDIELFMSNLLKRQVHVDIEKCNTNHQPIEATNGMIIYGCIILCFILMTLASTFYHICLISLRRSSSHQPKLIKNNSSSEYFLMIIKSFSLIENLQKLFQKSHDHEGLNLNAINGIKAILMMLILAGHSLLFIFGGPVLNSQFITIEVQRIQNAFLLNSVLFVDTFLLLSGFLFSRILLKELDKRNGRINILLLYIFRYIRLTPAYLAVIGFYITWLPIIGNGPLWKKRIAIEQKRCETSWWLNLLYINNYFNTNNLCMFQSWYLSADTQLFILAPIAIYLLWKKPKFGFIFIFSFGIITSISSSLFTYFSNLDPTLLIYEDEVRDISTNSFFINSYIKTHMRATGYVFGLLTGFLLHYITKKGIKIHKRLVNCLWILSTIIGFLSMFSITFFYINIKFTTIESSLYAGLHRLGWSLSTSWLIIASTTNNCGFLRNILCSRFFAPLSRLTYCSYLTNGLVELYMAGTRRVPVYMDHINLLGVTVSHAGYTFITAIILCLLFESPIHGIEKIFLKRDKKHQERTQHYLEDRSQISCSCSSSSNTPNTSECTA